MEKFGSDSVEVLESSRESQNDGNNDVVVEIAGAVEKPGVYKLKSDSRLEDLLIASGGLSADADRNYVEKNINKASKLIDGAKYYFPRENEQSDVLSANANGGIKIDQNNFSNQDNDLININTASLSQLDSLPGIGPVYGQNIIEHRPYSILEELVSKGAIKQNVYEKIKDLITCY